MHIHRTFREANQLADIIINTIFEQEKKYQYWGFSQLPSKACRILNINKSQIPSFWIKTRRIKDDTTFVYGE